jgi:hypothetical protein
MNWYAFALAACLAVAVGSNAFATNLITNGDFHLSNPWTEDQGFSTDYWYRQTTYSSDRDRSALIEGSYAFVAQASDVHWDWVSGFYDHTLGNSSGLYFVANGNTDTSYERTLWQSRPITVSHARTPYRFEAWIANVFSTDFSTPQLSFQIGDGMTAWTNLGAAASLDNVNAGVWLHTYVDCQFETTGTYYVRIMNSSVSLDGNDLGLDDIYFGLRSDSPSFGTDLGPPIPTLFSPVPVPEIDPAGMTSVVALVGGLLALAERRRHRCGLRQIRDGSGFSASECCAAPTLYENPLPSPIGSEPPAAETAMALKSKSAKALPPSGAAGTRTQDQRIKSPML